MEWLPDPRPVGSAVRLELAWHAVRAFPDDPKSWRALGAVVPAAEADAFLAEATARLPGSPLPLVLAARAALRRGDGAAARALSGRALALAPADPETLTERFLALSRLGDAECRAPALLDALAALRPTAHEVVEPLSAALITAGRAADAVALNRHAVAAAPSRAYPVYWLARALAYDRQDDEARHLLDLDRFIVRRELSPGSDGADFRRALAAEIQRNPSLLSDPEGKATRNGFQTEQFPWPGDRAAPDLIARMRVAVESYAAGLSAGDVHPFVRGRPTRARSVPWAVVYPENGRQAAHIHPNCWMTAVYYVAAPAAPGGGGALVTGGVAGWPALDKAPWGERVIESRAGEIILFPSWVPHYARPTGTADLRICVPLDVRAL